MGTSGFGGGSCGIPTEQKAWCLGGGGNVLILYIHTYLHTVTQVPFFEKGKRECLIKLGHKAKLSYCWGM